MFVNSGSFITLTHSYENHYFGIQVPVPVLGINIIMYYHSQVISQNKKEYYK
jgi:hypothetical protein